MTSPNVKSSALITLFTIHDNNDDEFYVYPYTSKSKALKSAAMEIIRVIQDREERRGKEDWAGECLQLLQREEIRNAIESFNEGQEDVCISVYDKELDLE